MLATDLDTTVLRGLVAPEPRGSRPRPARRRAARGRVRPCPPAPGPGMAGRPATGAAEAGQGSEAGRAGSSPRSWTSCRRWPIPGWSRRRARCSIAPCRSTALCWRRGRASTHSMADVSQVILPAPGSWPSGAGPHRRCGAAAKPAARTLGPARSAQLRDAVVDMGLMDAAEAEAARRAVDRSALSARCRRS